MQYLLEISMVLVDWVVRMTLCTCLGARIVLAGPLGEPIYIRLVFLTVVMLLEMMVRVFISCVLMLHAGHVRAGIMTWELILSLSSTGRRVITLPELTAGTILLLFMRILSAWVS